jgi:hypothetical protein
MQNFAIHIDQAHRHQSAEMTEIKANQVRLSDWLRDRASLWSMPPYRQGNV